MPTTIGSGLGATWGLAMESSVGTFVAPTRWIPHLKAEIKNKKKTVQSQALRGNRFELASRRALLSYSVDGSLELDAADRQLGIIFQAMLGCAAPLNTQQGATSAWLQTHTTGVLEGIGLSMQKGEPQTNGTIQAFSYAGMKVLDWTLSVQRDQIAKLSLTLDGISEATSTSYTAAAYLADTSAPNLLTFAEGSLTLGGTVSTASGITTVTGGTAPVGLVSGVTIKGQNKIKQDRFPLGSR